METWKLWFCSGWLDGSAEDKTLPGGTCATLKEGAEWLREEANKLKEAEK